jgi:hypothetical protein
MHFCCMPLFSLGPVYKFVCVSFSPGNLNCFRVKLPWRSTWCGICAKTWIGDEGPKNDPAPQNGSADIALTSEKQTQKHATAFLKCTYSVYIEGLLLGVFIILRSCIVFCGRTARGAEKRADLKNRLPVFHMFLSAAHFNKLIENYIEVLD